MNLPELFERFPFLRTYAMPLGIGCIGVILLGYGMISSFQSHPQSNFQSFDTNTTPDAVSTVPATLSHADIIIDVEGAVNKPGLVTVSSDARMADALRGAGGISSTADQQWMQKHVNLAAKLADGAKIYILHVGESVAGDSVVAAATDTSMSTSGMVNINTASETDLDNLPGIGATTALKIISNRPYTDINDLVTKKIVNKKVFGEIKSSITVE